MMDYCCNLNSNYRLFLTNFREIETYYMLLLLLPILRLYICHFEHSAILRYKDHKIVDLYCKARVFVQIVVGGI
jgi:hypothetical protein